MTAKEYLLQIRDLDNRITRLEHERASLRADLYRIGSPSDMSERVQTSKTDDTFLRLIAKIDRKEREIVREIDRLVDLKEKITGEIERLEDERNRSILMYRYVMMKSWSEIAKLMGYAENTCYLIHGQALQEFRQMKVSSKFK